jgi:hypothetical protein
VFGIAIALSIARLASFNSAVGQITGPMLVQIETAAAWAANVSESMRHARDTLINARPCGAQAGFGARRGLAAVAFQLPETDAFVRGKIHLVALFDAEGIIKCRLVHLGHRAADRLG